MHPTALTLRPVAPRRPLVAAALAALLGAAVGSAASGEFFGFDARGLLRWIAGAAVVWALGATCLGFIGGGRASRGAAVLVLLGALAALRAAGAAADAPTTHGDASEVIEGRYRPTGRFDGIERGRIEGAARSLALPAGLVRPGEWLRIDAGAPTKAPARGPVQRGSPPLPLLELAADEVERLAPPPSGLAQRVRTALWELRARALARVERGLPHAPTRGLVAAMLLGERGGLDPSRSDLFTRTGTRHLLAISGLHVGLVASLVALPIGLALSALARRTRRAPRWMHTPAPWWILALAPLVPLSGAGAPVTRAFVAVACFALTRCLPPTRTGELRRADPLSLLSLAVLLEICARPDAAASLSVQLSYSATLGLILATGPLSRALARAAPAGGRFPLVTRYGRRVPSFVRIPAQRTMKACTTALAVSLAASLATLPVVWTHFGELGFVGVVATPLALPFVAGLLASGWAWLAVPCAPLESALELCGAGLVTLLEFADRVPGSPTPLPPRPETLLWLATAGALAAAAARASRGVVRATALAWGVLLLPWKPAPAGLELWVLDVGHGTCAVLRAPGMAPLVFDAGSRDRRGVARGALAPLLASLEARRANYALSHVDSDHSSALPWTLERFPPLLWLGARTTEIEAALPRGVPRLDADVGRVEFRLAARALEPLCIEVLRGRLGDDNQGSRSLLVEWGGARLLLAGDADDAGLAHMLAEGWLEGPLRLLLVPHHGSESRYLAPLLDGSSPEEVWISVGAPAPVERELGRRGLRWRSTAAHGPLELMLAPHGGSSAGGERNWTADGR